MPDKSEDFTDKLCFCHDYYRKGLDCSAVRSRMDPPPIESPDLIISYTVKKDISWPGEMSFNISCFFISFTISLIFKAEVSFSGQKRKYNFPLKTIIGYG